MLPTLSRQDPLYFNNGCQTIPLQAALDTYAKFACICDDRNMGGQLAQEAAAMKEEARDLVKKWFGLPQDQWNEWSVIFGYNTSQLINLFSLSLKEKYLKNKDKITPISLLKSHNSSFLQGKWWEKGNGGKSLLVYSFISNVDGQRLHNFTHVPTYTILDTAQGMFSVDELTKRAQPNLKLNEIFIFSAHKIYSTHLGVALIPTRLLKEIDPMFVGGGTVDYVGLNSFNFAQDVQKKWEVGLPDTGSICALATTLKELMQSNAKDFYKKDLQILSKKLETGLVDLGYTLVKTNPEETTSVVSFYKEDAEPTYSHEIGHKLAEAGITCRTGFLCANSYFLEKKLPPVVRLSLGLNTTEEAVDKVLETLKD